MPLVALAIAKQAFNAIQQGCELYKEYKGTVAEIQKTYKEVAGIANEAFSLWKFIKNKLFGKPPTIQKVTETVTKRVVKHDELEITTDILKQLKIFFSAMAQMKDKVAKLQEKSLEAHTEDELLSSSIDIEYALIEVAKLQKQIRETMVYQIGGDLGDMYTKMVKRVAIIQEEQEVARLEALKKRRDEEWLRQRQERIRHRRMAVATILLLVVLQVWGLMLPIVMIRDM